MGYRRLISLIRYRKAAICWAGQRGMVWELASPRPPAYTLNVCPPTPGCSTRRRPASYCLTAPTEIAMALKTISLEQEINPWEAQAARFDFAAHKLNLDEGIMKVLRYPTREIILHIPVMMDNGRLEVFTGFRVQHSIARGPAK